ncbi:hypothetical protein SESBI_37248 [Sesbania bispinosa]|nr:hypothetical protein SESBI_37248 [Sesbania bispinosa]
MHSSEALTMAVVEDSLEGAVVEDSLEGVETLQELDLNRNVEEDEVQSDKTKDVLCCALDDVVTEKGLSTINLNKFPEEDYEDESLEGKEKKSVVRKMLMIYLYRFY